MKKLSYLIVLTLILGLTLTGCLLTNVGQVPTSEQSGVSGMTNSKGAGSYSDVTLIQWQSGNFSEVWDLTQCDLTLSYTIDMSAIATAGWVPVQVGLRQVGAPNLDPNDLGGFLLSNFASATSSDPDYADLNDYHVLMKHGWLYEYYNREGTFPGVSMSDTVPWAYINHAFWFDRDGVDEWQATYWNYEDGDTYNTEGVYEVVIQFHALDSGNGVMYATINDQQQGFYTMGYSSTNPPDMMPVGRTFTGDMTKMQVFYGRGGGGGTVIISDITVDGCWAECKVDLIAGQNEVAGTVTINDDGVNLLITYETTGDWEMTETHLYVGKTNPEELTSAPGQFPYSEEHDPAVSTFTYIIPLAEVDSYSLSPKGKKWVADGSPGIGGIEDQIYIAAHAEVIRPIDGCWETIWQIGDSETIACPDATPTLLTNYADEFNWDDPAGPCTMGPGLASVEPSFTDPFIVGATPVSEFPYNSNYGRNYATDFDVQWNGSLPFGGLLIISWSPGQSASEKKVVSEDGIIPTTLTATGKSEPGQGWFMDKYPLVEHTVAVGPLTIGDHIINFQHTQGDGTFWDWIKLEKPCEQEETAWAEGDPIRPEKNWAMYFEYPCD